MIDTETLRKLIRYEPETGKLYWLPRPESMFKEARLMRRWNTRYANTEALAFRRPDGYLDGHLLEKRYKAHRVCWALYHGHWPSIEIDHINGNPSDNRIVNLREANKSQNSSNRRSVQNSSSRYLGVYWHSRDTRWVAAIYKERRIRHLGYFKSEVDAAMAYDAVAKSLHGRYAKLNFPDVL